MDKVLENDDVRAESLSAVFDGECTPDDLDVVLAAAAANSVSERWRNYQLIGDALRQTEPVRRPSMNFDLLMARVAAENRAQAQHTADRHSRRVAANDPVLRWKLAAGVASLAALGSLGWALLGSAGAPAPGQLAQAAPQQTPPAVLVTTPSGPMLRDPGLEALLDTHRQLGGWSAVQMSSGFLRNATYDSPQR